MTSRWYLLPLVLIVFVLGFLLGPHGGDGQPAAAQVKLADIPVSGGDWSLGAVHALPILHGPSVGGVHPARSARARAPARRTGGPRIAAAPSTPVRTAPVAAPTPAPTAAPPPPAATPPPAKPAPAPAPASQSAGARFDSTGSSTFDTAR
jgi:hypothetical protein